MYNIVIISCTAAAVLNAGAVDIHQPLQDLHLGPQKKDVVRRLLEKPVGGRLPLLHAVVFRRDEIPERLQPLRHRLRRCLPALLSSAAIVAASPRVLQNSRASSPPAHPQYRPVDLAIQAKARWHRREEEMRTRPPEMGSNATRSTPTQPNFYTKASGEMSLFSPIITITPQRGSFISDSQRERDGKLVIV